MVLCLDVETSVYAKGNPFVPDNKLVCISYSDGATIDCKAIEHSTRPPYGDSLAHVQSLVDQCDVLVGFNIKFDLHWLRRYAINFDTCTIFDCQLAAFILNHQRIVMPSLENMAMAYLGKHKLDIVKTEYWEHGIDTPDIPWDVLRDYANEDVKLTEELYYYFQEILNKDENKKLKRLLSLSNQDLLTLEEMEWNGMKFDFEKSQTKAKEVDEKLATIYTRLNNLVSSPTINWNSGDHVSCVLYGGIITTPTKTPNGYYKSGARIGQPRFSWSEEETKMERLVEPLKSSKLKKEGYWSTSEDTLKQLRAKGKAKEIVQLILEAAKLEKLNGTYYRGIPELARILKWSDGFIHGSYNQTTAVTGRLSSSRPNMQNFAGEVDELLTTRFL